MPEHLTQDLNRCHCALYALGALVCIGVLIWLTI
jgi:hypothetical protein